MEVKMDPNLTFINLKFFCDTAQGLSVSEAARMNFVTQSAISQGIKKLEKAFRVPLTNHSRHNLQLTQEGKIVVEKGRRILRSLKEINDTLKEDRETVSGTVLIACTPSIAMNFMNQTIRLLQLKHPEVCVELKIGNPEAIREWVHNGLVDFGLAIASPIFDSFEQTTLRKGNFCIFSTGSTLKNGVFVDEKNGLFVDFLKVQYRKKYEKELSILSELGSWELVAQFASERDKGCGYFPDYLAAKYPNLKKLQESFSLPSYELVALVNKADVLSTASKAFFECFSELEFEVK